MEIKNNNKKNKKKKKKINNFFFFKFIFPKIVNLLVNSNMGHLLKLKSYIFGQVHIFVLFYIMV